MESSSEGSKSESNIIEYLSSAEADQNIENHTKERPLNSETQLTKNKSNKMS